MFIDYTNLVYKINDVLIIHENQPSGPGIRDDIIIGKVLGISVGLTYLCKVIHIVQIKDEKNCRINTFQYWGENNDWVQKLTEDPQTPCFMVNSRDSIIITEEKCLWDEYSWVFVAKELRKELIQEEGSTDSTT